MAQDGRTQLRQDIESLLQRNPSGLTVPQLVERTGADIDAVRSIIGRLRDKLLIRATKPGNSNTAYHWARGDMENNTPPNKINKMDGKYEPLELLPFDGRPEANQHEAYGTRVGNKIYYRDGRVEDVK